MNFEINTRSAVNVYQTRCNEWQRVVAITMALLTITTNLPFFVVSTYAAETEASPSIPELLKKIHAVIDPKNPDANFDLLEKVIAATPRSANEVGAKAEELGNDVDKIFAFVRDQVRDEVYAGVLRGPRGTLTAMAGNACDKTLLLAELLRHHRVEVRFVEGHLKSERAESLVQQMFSSLGNRGTKKESVAIPESFRAASEAANDLVMARFESNVKSVVGTLNDANVRMANQPAATPKSLAGEAADHHLWLEFQNAGKWIALDPSFAEAKPGQIFGDNGETSAAPPTALFHRIGFRLILEERVENEMKSREILRHDSTAAELNAAAVSLSFDASATQSEWSATPVLQVNGNPLKGETFSGPVGGLGGSAAQLGKSLFAAPGKLPKRSSGGITGIWLDIDFVAPSGEKETVRRGILDRLGSAARAAKRESTAALASLSEASRTPVVFNSELALRFACGDVNPAAEFERAPTYLNDIKALKTSGIADKAARHELGEEDAAKLKTASSSGLQLLATNFQLISQGYQEVARQWPKQNKFALYQASPRLIIASVTWETGKPVMAIDLRRNQLRVAANEAAGDSAGWLNLFRGIMDATLEQLVLGDLIPSAGKGNLQTSATDIFERARANGTDFKMVREPDDLKGMSAPENTKTQLLARLGENVALVAPTKSVSIDSKPRCAWWQINLQSGDTVAVLDNGLHGAATELSLLEQFKNYQFFEFSICMALILGLGIVMIPMFEYHKRHYDPFTGKRIPESRTP